MDTIWIDKSKRAVWLHCYSNVCDDNFYCCTNCDKRFYQHCNQKEDYNYYNLPRICPKCGAKMTKICR